MVSGCFRSFHGGDPLVVEAEQGRVEVRTVTVGLSTDRKLRQDPLRGFRVAPASEFESSLF